MAILNLTLKYKFRNPSLMELALTQSGADQENNNERLEFIGDRVLGLVVAELVYTMFPNEPEGDLARRHAVLVSTETLARVAVGLKISERIHHGHMTGGRMRHMFANTMEAVLGAIYLDGGFDAAHTVITEIWRDLAASDKCAPKDPKTKLQEYVQKVANGALPVYEYAKPVGASHSPEFTVTVTALDHSATATGTSKKLASVAAAKELMKILAIS